jgi:hypothetical protein
MDHNTVASILNIELGPWDIVDSVDEKENGANLVMVHHRSMASTEKYGWIRGIVIDIEKRAIICPPYGPEDSYISTVVSDSLVPASDGTLSFVDDQMANLSMNVRNVTIEHGYEGTVIRVMCHKGKTYYCTHKSFDAQSSRWVVSRSFYDLYVDLGGPTDLFTGSAEDYEEGLDHEVYYFLVVHQEVQAVSQSIRDKGHLIFLGAKNSTVISRIKEQQLSERFPRPKSLSIREANDLLAGDISQPDYRFRGGEFVILIDRTTNKMVKVISKSYKWRQDVRDDNPNIKHLWYKSVSDSYINGKFSISEQDFLKKYPLTNIVSVNDLERAVFSTMSFTPEPYAGRPSDVTSSPGARLHTILQTLLIVLPPFQKVEILKIYREFFVEKKRIIEWIFGLYRHSVDLSKFDQEGKTNRVKQIIKDVISFADRRMNTPDMNRRCLPRENLVHENIANLINKEMGMSLYRLYKIMEADATPVN